MEYYNLGNDLVAFTTDRRQGREREAIIASIGAWLSEQGRAPLRLRHDVDFLYPHQTHTDKVVTIDEDLLALSAEERTERLEGVDAIISNLTDVVLGISTADCIPVVVYDPDHHAAAAIHAGWKGTVQRIVEKAISAMQQAYGTQPSACRATIGPGISQESFEVGQEVVDTFVRASLVTDAPPLVCRLPSSEAYRSQHGDSPLSPHIDLKEINRRQLLSAGLPSQNIEVSAVDTFTDSRFFSARREQKGPQKCGRILSGFILSKK